MNNKVIKLWQLIVITAVIALILAIQVLPRVNPLYFSNDPAPDIAVSEKEKALAFANYLPSRVIQTPTEFHFDREITYIIAERDFIILVPQSALGQPCIIFHYLYNGKHFWDLHSKKEIYPKKVQWDNREWQPEWKLVIMVFKQ